MNRVDHHRDSGDRRGEAAEDPRLGAVRMQNIHPLRAQETDELEEESRVVGGAHLAVQPREGTQGRVPEPRGLGVEDSPRAPAQADLEARPVVVATAVEGVLLRAPELQPGDEMVNAQPAHGGSG